MTDEEFTLIARIALRSASTSALCANALRRAGLLDAQEKQTIARNLQAIADELEPTERDAEAVQYHLLARLFRD
ncbi:hypothetical protein [Sphingobium olei]|uniref:Uncharacterized protein n=1 Tax=Sphingobium olei TaxID=420955 RepID=A0ABW3NYE0_9SPHN